MRLLAVLAYCLLTPSVAWAQQCVLLGGSNTATSTTATRFVAFASQSGPAATENQRNGLIPFSGQVSTLRIELSGAPDTGAGTQSYQFTVRVDKADTAIICTVSETATSCADTTNVVSVTAGQELSLEITPSASAPTARSAQWVLSYHGNTTALPNRITVWPSSTAGNTISATANTFWGIQGLDVSATEFEVEQIIPTAGVVKNFYVELDGSPNNGAGTQTYTFTVMQNSVASAITCNISEAATTCNDTTNSFTVAAGDGVSIRSSIAAGTPTIRRASTGTAFEPTVEGEFVIAAANDTDLDTLATQYRRLQGVGSAVSATETVVQQLANAMTLTNFYVETSAAPDIGVGVQDYTFTVRDNVADISLACVISETATTCNDTGTDVIAAADNMAISIVPSIIAPVAVDAHYSCTGYIAPRRMVLVE